MNTNDKDSIGRKILPGDFDSYRVAIRVVDGRVVYHDTRFTHDVENSMLVSSWHTTARNGKSINEVSPLVRDRNDEVIEAGKTATHETMIGKVEIICLMPGARTLAWVRKDDGQHTNVYADKLTIWKKPKEVRVHFSVVVPETTDVNKLFSSIRGAKIENVRTENL